MISLLLIAGKQLSELEENYILAYNDCGLSLGDIAYKLYHYRSSIPGQVIPKTQKMVFDAASLQTQHYKVRVIKGKVEQFSSAFPYTLVLLLLKRDPSGHPRLRSATLIFLLYHSSSDVSQKILRKTKNYL